MNQQDVTLQWLLGDIAPELADLRIRNVVRDSRHVQPGDLFVAISGTQTDGHEHVCEAVTRGAVAVVASKTTDAVSVPQIIVPCSMTAFARLTMKLYAGGTPPLCIAGITGTNGKTTSTWILRSILRSAGFQTGLLGTIHHSDGVVSQPSTMTTPSPEELAVRMRSMLDAGTTHCVMEVSSHALAQNRCVGLRLSAAAITNVTQDHFDYHGTVEAYRNAKVKISELLHTDAPLLLNLNDPGCRYLLHHFSLHMPVTYGVDNPDAELSARILNQTHRSQRIQLKLAQGDAQVRLRLIGRHNVENALVAAGMAEQLGVPLKRIVSGLESIGSIPGRLERIDEGQSFQLLVDYAHTPDALSRCIDTVTDFAPGRVICVFGAGGNRDASKRPLMAKAAMKADVAIVTSDNPRSENPVDIIRQIVAGFDRNMQYEIRMDREEAIARAIDLAEPGDVVLIAGKGHETTQEIGTHTFPFDDREAARSLIHRKLTASGRHQTLAPRESTFADRTTTSA